MNRWNQSAVLSIMLFFYAISLTAQEGGVPPAEDRNTQLARSNPDYLVTAGDVYTLAYNANGAPITYTITVDSSYRIRISNLGIINAAGRTFRQLKNDAEAIVSNNYPLSGVQLVLSQPGIFRVFVKGEVQTATEISTWALARLSSLTGHMTAYASLRDITIKSSNGQVRNYDLFKADRLGDLSQNPYLRPDDEITFNRLERRVTINGAVERPGAYQLLTDEHLNDLIETYAKGFTPLADKTRMELVRYLESDSISGDRMLLKESDVRANYILRNYDVITIPSITDTRPVATVDRLERRITLAGAVRRPGTYDLLPNENLRDLIETYGDGFTPLADKTRIELVRYVGGGSISGDKLLLQESAVQDNYLLQNYDVITIPNITELRPVATVDRFERRITLDGAVRRPGTYELLPDENLRDLIEIYGDGLNPLADPSRIEIVRYVNSNSASGDKIAIGEAEIAGNYPLENYDSVFIPTIVSLRPVFFIEGAIKNTNENVTGPSASFREVVSFNRGETYSAVVRRNTRWFTAESDTANAYIERNTERIPINLNRILYDAGFRSEILIEENDLLIVPFRQYFVTVAGAVAVPGRYPYIPDRNWEYYVSLAGGFLPERNAAARVRIQDFNGKTLKKTDLIGPETTITAVTNHWLYYFNQIAPVLTATLSIVSTIISISLLAR